MRLNTGRRLFSGATIYLGANILNAAIPFLLVPVLTRTLTPADYGTVAMFGIAVSVLGAFTGLNAQGSVGVRYFQRGPGDLAPYVGSCIAILVASSGAIALAVLGGGGLVAVAAQLPIAWVLSATFIAASQALVTMRLSLWQAQGKPFTFGLFQVAQSAMNAGLSLFFVLTLALAWQGRALAQVCASGVFALIALYTLIRDRDVASPTRLEDARDALRFGIPLVPHALGALAISAADRFIIAHCLDLAHAGIYMVALQVGTGLALVTDAFNKAYAPWLMRTLSQANGEQKIRIVRLTYTYFAALALGAATLGLAAPPLMSILVGDQFRAAAPAVIYIAGGFAFGGMYFMVTNYVFYAGRTSWLAWITFASGALNVAATYALVRLYGVKGAGQAFMISQAALFLGTWLLAQKASPMPWRAAVLTRSRRRADIAEDTLRHLSRTMRTETESDA